MPLKTISSFATITLFSLLSLVGLALIFEIPLQLYPSYTNSSLNISFGYAGASPATIEQRVTSVLEAQLSLINEVNDVNSTSGNGWGTIGLTLSSEADVNLVGSQVSQLINNVYPDLPKGISYPEVRIGGPSSNQQPILVYRILTDKTDNESVKYLEDKIVRPIQQLKGVGQVQLYGITPYQWNIIIDYNKILKLGISNSELLNSIRLELYQLPFGIVQMSDGSQKQVIVKGLNGQSAAELMMVPVHTGKEGNIAYLRDFATIERQLVPASNYYRLNGRKNITIVVYPQEGENQVKLTQRIKNTAEDLKKSLPENIELLVIYDNTEFISEEIKTIIHRAALTLLLLLLFIGLTSFNWRYTLVITFGLLCNLAINFSLYYLFGVQLHLYSFAGITVSLGLLIDNSIVMTDHLRHKKNKKVFLAIFASTLTTIASLSIIFFLDKKAQLNLIDFALVLIINLTVSLLVALFFIPALVEKIPVHNQAKKGITFKRKRFLLPITTLYPRIVYSFIRFRWIWIVVLIFSFGVPLFLLPVKIEKDNLWSKIYNKTLGSTLYTRTIGPIIEKIAGGTLRAFVVKVDHGQFYSEKEPTSIVLLASMEDGATLEQMNEVFIEIENYLKQFPQINRFESSINGYNDARMIITFKPEHEFTSFPIFLQNELIKKSIDFSSIDARIYGQGDGFSNSMKERVGNYKVEILGYNYGQVYKYAEELREVVLRNPRIKEANIMGSDNYYRDKSWEYVLKSDREKIAIRNVNYKNLSDFLSLITTSDRYIGTIKNGEKTEKLVISSVEAKDFNYWQLENTVLPAQKTLFKPGVIADVSKQKTSTSINRRNQQYAVFVEWDFIGTDQLGKVVLDELMERYTEQLPMGYKIENKKYVYRSKDEKNEQARLIFFVVLIIYMICAILFESLWQPLAVISLIPITFIGVFLAFWMFDISFGQGGYSAMILLCGLTVNSAMFIINEMNNFNKSGVTGNRGYFLAYRSKILPIVLTILSTIMGMLPYLLAGEKEDFWFPLAVATCSGLAFSILGILFILPMFFVSNKKV